ncbi:MAG: undecaprenyl/decaprenyl-phosphate alpha-N-acetylglucosaminyl 1-phosphate transferase, partial [Planctomycetes bacterium]|nr:undecaprenyl/decaprenyl-phosphate alpha-N-acetylglucosaminyl 1-phosphate transferase [Planctomycetota bacterium]
EVTKRTFAADPWGGGIRQPAVGVLQTGVLHSRIMHTVVLLAVALSFLLSLAMTAAVRTWSRRTGFVDHPGGHKQHGSPVALGGGIALVVSIFGPILVGVVAARILDGGPPPEWLPAIIETHLAGIASKFSTVLAIAGGAVALHIVGLIDDRRALGPWPKFAVQLAVALFLAGPVGIRAVEALPAPLSIAVTVVWIVLITNAFNFLDNMDGLCAGVTVVAAAIFAVASMRAGQVFVPIMAWIVVGSVLGFLVFNFNPASVFMGDAGSLVLGYLMAVLTILVTFYDPAQNSTPFGVLVPVVVLAVPIYDMISVVVHRMRLGVSPFRGDQRHFSHRLTRRGFSARGAVLTIYLATAATGLPAIVLPTVDWLGAILLLLQGVCVVVMIAVLEHTDLDLNEAV